MIWTRHRTAARMMLLLLAVCGVAFAASPAPAAPATPAAGPQATAATATPAEMPAETPDPELLTRYCVRCHSDRLETGGLTLEHVDVDRIAEDPELWEKIAWKIRIGAMPKVPAPRPERPVLDRFASAVESALDRAAAASPDPGPPTFHRLNRLQYVNAVRDLLGRGRRRPESAAAGRIQLRLRQRPWAVHHALAARPLPVRRRPDRPRRRRRSDHSADHRDVSHRANGAAGRAHERGPALRHQRRPGRPAYFPARRRVRCSRAAAGHELGRSLLPGRRARSSSPWTAPP